MLVVDAHILLIHQLPCHVVEVTHLAGSVVPHSLFGKKSAFTKEPVTQNLFMDFLEMCIGPLVSVIRSVIAMFEAQLALAVLDAMFVHLLDFIRRNAFGFGSCDELHSIERKHLGHRVNVLVDLILKGVHPPFLTKFGMSFLLLLKGLLGGNRSCEVAII